MTKSQSRTTRSEANAKAPQASRRRRWVKLISRTLSLIAVGLIVAHWFWARSAERNLDEQIRIYAAAGEPIYPADLNDEPLPESENAVLELREAGRLLKDSAVEWITFAQLNPGPPLSPKHMEIIFAVMQANRDALKHLDAAAAKSRIDWQMKFASPVLEVRFEELNNSLHLASLLRAAALYAHQDGTEGEALVRVRQMLALSRIVDRQRRLSAHVTAASIAALAAKTASDIAPDLRVRMPSARVLHDLIAEFLDDASLRDGQLRALYMTRVMFWDTAKTVAGGRGDLLSRGDGTGIAGGRIGCYANKPLLMNDGLWLVRYMSTLANAAKYSADWPEFCQNAPPDAVELLRNQSGHLIANRLLPDLPRVIRVNYRASAECRLAGLALAAAWYAGDRAGVMPASLEELKPNYLPYVPFDPMAGGGKPLRLGGVAERRVIYSVGDDGVDDGGSEVAPASHYGAGPGAGTWDRRDFVVRLTRRPAVTKPATAP